MPESQQPQLMISVSGGYLVFIGLIVAASATVLASDRASELPMWARAILLVPLAISAASGVSALVGANSAHNLGRRIEKLAARDLDDMARAKLEPEVKAAREFARLCIWWSLTGAFVSAVALILAILPFVFYSKADAKTSENGTVVRPPSCVKVAVLARGYVDAVPSRVTAGEHVNAATQHRIRQ